MSSARRSRGRPSVLVPADPKPSAREGAVPQCWAVLSSMCRKMSLGRRRAGGTYPASEFTSGRKVGSLVWEMDTLLKGCTVLTKAFSGIVFGSRRGTWQRYNSPQRCGESAHKVAILASYATIGRERGVFHDHRTALWSERSRMVCAVA